MKFSPGSNPRTITLPVTDRHKVIFIIDRASAIESNSYAKRFLLDLSLRLSSIAGFTNESYVAIRGSEYATIFFLDLKTYLLDLSLDMTYETKWYKGKTMYRTMVSLFIDTGLMPSSESLEEEIFSQMEDISKDDPVVFLEGEPLKQLEDSSFAYDLDETITKDWLDSVASGKKPDYALISGIFWQVEFPAITVSSSDIPGG